MIRKYRINPNAVSLYHFATVSRALASIASRLHRDSMVGGNAARRKSSGWC